MSCIETIEQVIVTFTWTFLCLCRIIDSKKGFWAKATTIFKHNRLESVSTKAVFCAIITAVLAGEAWFFGVLGFVVRLLGQRFF